MKSYRNRSFSDTISAVGSMLLFLMFAGCMLMIIAVAAGTYSRINSAFDKTFGSSASLRYISNKLRSAESAEIIEDGSGLLLKSGEVLEIIYFRDGGLYEKNIPESASPDISGGDKIFELNGMSVSEMGNLYKITVGFENEENSTLVRKG